MVKKSNFWRTRHEKLLGVYTLLRKKWHTIYRSTNDIIRRVYEHKQKLLKGYTKKYSVNKLVYAEEYHDINTAIEREKILKKWKRAWKIALIEQQNPNWDDLYNLEFSFE